MRAVALNYLSTSPGTDHSKWIEEHIKKAPCRGFQLLRVSQVRCYALSGARPKAKHLSLTGAMPNGLLIPFPDSNKWIASRVML